MRRLLPTLALGALAACSGSELGSVVPFERTLLQTPSSVLGVLPGGTVVAEVDGQLVEIDPRRPDAEPVVVGPSADIGAIRTAVPVGDAVLVLATHAAYVVRDSTWVPSPLAGALDGPIAGAVMLAPGELWILTESSLYRVQGGSMERLELEGSLAGARLAAVRRAEGPALWMLLSDRLVEVWEDRSGVLRAARLVLPGVPTAIAGDASGTGWLVLDGRLHSLGYDRRLLDHGLAAARVLASPAAREVWSFASDGAATLHADGRFYAAENASVREDELVALGADGSLYVAGSSVRRLAPRRDVRIEGAPDGAVLVTPQVFAIVLEGAPLVEASVGDRALEVLADPLRVMLTPAELGDGPHELVIRVTYDDGTLPYEERRRFEVVTSATWSGHVRPIHEAHCAACHGAEGPAVTRLDTREAWMARADTIVFNVREGRMPLNRPPLSQRELALIEAWIESGFPE
ncbi:MAG TPA: cytochrome c [Sandaracinaceae bacterium]